MDIARTAVGTVVVAILGVTLASGPLVGSLALPPEDPDRGRLSCDIEGTVDVEVRQLPTESFVFDSQEFGSEAYTLESDPLIIDVGGVKGCPLVSYELRVPELGIFSFQNYYPTEDDVGAVTMSMVPTTYEQHRIENESYDARVDVKITGDRNRTLVSENFTIPVDE